MGDPVSAHKVECDQGRHSVSVYSFYMHAHTCGTTFIWICLHMYTSHRQILAEKVEAMSWAPIFFCLCFLSECDMVSHFRLLLSWLLHHGTHKLWAKTIFSLKLLFKYFDSAMEKVTPSLCVDVSSSWWPFHDCWKPLSFIRAEQN